MSPDQIVTRLNAIVRHTTVTNSTSGGVDQVAGRQGPQGKQNVPHTVRRLWPFGIRSVPPSGVEAAVVFANADPTHGLMVGAEGTGYGPSDLATGETALYCKAAGTVVKLDGDGNVTISSASGKTVTINGATVYLGAMSGAQFVALSNLVATELGKIASAHNGHKHAGVQPGTGVSGLVDTTYSAGSVAASQTKAV